MRETLCRAFCDSLLVREVPAGWAIRTGFSDNQGDYIGFYVVNGDGRFRIEDSGRVLPELEAQGLDFRSGSRGEAFQSLLEEYGISLDERQFSIADLDTERAVANAAIRFVAFLLRVSDFSLMTEARVASTFREDVKRMLFDAVSGKAEIEEEAAILPDLADFPADFVLRAPERPPVGVYVATGDNRALQAVIVRMRAQHETLEDCRVVALIETGNTLTAPVRRQATNRLDALAEFRGDEYQSIRRVAQEAIGATYH